MKQKDWLLVAVIVIISGTVSFVISGKLISPTKHPLKTPVVEKISSDFANPQTDKRLKRYYKSDENPDPLNPTQLIRVGGTTSPIPFGTQ